MGSESNQVKRDSNVAPGPVVLPPEPTAITVFCPECGEAIRVKDIHGYILGVHVANVCGELSELRSND